MNRPLANVLPILHIPEVSLVQFPVAETAFQCRTKNGRGMTQRSAKEKIIRVFDF